MVDAEKENFEAERSGDPARKARARELHKVALEQQKKAHDRKSAGGASTPPHVRGEKVANREVVFGKGATENLVLERCE